MKNRYRNLRLFSIYFVLSLIFVGKSYAGWMIQSVDTIGDVGEVSSIAVDSKNNSHIAYYDATNYKLKYAKWTGSEWSITTVDSMGNIGTLYYLNIDIELDSSDNPHISYYDGLNGDLKYAKWTGSSWAIKTVDSTGDVGQYSSMVLDSMDNPHISYCDSTRHNLKYAKWTGVGWSITTVDYTNFSYDNSIALDSAGNPHIAYFGYRNKDLEYAKWTGSSWAFSTICSEGDVGEYPSIAIDSADTPHISYRDDKNYKLKYAKWTGSAWAIKTIGYSFRKTALAIDSSDNVHIAYYDDTNYELKYTKGTAGSWSTQIVDSSGENPAMALDSKGIPHISYYLDTDLKYAQWANSPELSWTGEPSYESDGLNPEIGDNSTEFTFRVKYSHLDNKAPKSGYPKLIIKNSSGDTYQAIPMNYISGNYNTGAIYSISTILPLLSYNWFSYSFEAYDLDNVEAINFISGNGPGRAYLSGYIKGPNGNAAKDVLVTLSGSASGTTTTDSSGYYQFNTSLGGNYIVTPSSGNTSFNPFNRTCANLNSVQSLQNFIRIVSNPSLSWTDEPSYQSTGLYPEIGNSSTIFTYRVKYTDLDNEPPQTGFPKVVIKEPFFVLKTLSMNYVSGNYNTGAIYSISTTLPFDNEKDYSYQFEAYDIWGDSATSFVNGVGPKGTYLSGYLINPDNSDMRNIPVLLSGGETREKFTNSYGYYCFDVNPGLSYAVTPTVSNYTFSPSSRTFSDIMTSMQNQDFVRVAGNPILSWTGETSYESGGVNQKEGYQTTIFVFRIKYTDAENDPPSYNYPLLHILKGGAEINGSPFSMNSADYNDDKYDDGKIYSYSTNLDAGTNYAYYLEACDLWKAKAAGEATELKIGLVVSALQLSMVGEAKVVGPAASRGLINPGKGDKAQIYFQGTKIGDFSCQIYNVDGELIFEATQNNVNNGFFEWQPTDIASGVYLVHVEGPGVNFKRKMVLLR